jgi:uroporphyrinogen decarboxylase
VVTAARGGVPDVLPVGLYNGNQAVVAAGFHIGECCTDGKKLAEAQLASWEELGQDVITVVSDGMYIAEAMGSVVAHHRDSLPSLETPAVREISDIARLRKPDPRRDGRMPVYLEAIRVVRGRAGDTVAIRGCGAGPFVQACHLMGTERFVLELAQAEHGLSDSGPALHELLGLCCDILVDFVSVQLELGATIVQLGDSSASPDIISPDIYEKFALPYEQRFFDTVRPLCRAKGAVSLLHICGNTTKILPLLARTGADLIEVDHKVDLGEAKRAVGGRAALIGNLDPAGSLLFGKAVDVEGAARDCIEKAAAGGGFILGSGCEVAVATPRGNLEAAVRTARAHRYSMEGAGGAA